MSEEQTYIADYGAAMIATGRAYNTAKDMQTNLTNLFGRIVGLQASRPWGTSEAGDAFGRIYHTDKGGADFVLSNGSKVIDAMTKTLSLAATAVRDSTALDEQQASSLFQVPTDILGPLSA